MGDLKTRKLGPKGQEIDVDAFLFDCANVEPEALDEPSTQVWCVWGRPMCGGEANICLAAGLRGAAAGKPSSLLLMRATRSGTPLSGVVHDEVTTPAAACRCWPRCCRTMARILPSSGACAITPTNWTNGRASTRPWP